MLCDQQKELCSSLSDVQQQRQQAQQRSLLLQQTLQDTKLKQTQISDRYVVIFI